MITLYFQKAVNGQKLARELVTARPSLAAIQGLVDWTDTEAWIHLPDGASQAVQDATSALVLAHDPAPVPVPSVKDQIDAALASIDPTKPAAAITTLKAVLSVLAGKVRE